MAFLMNLSKSTCSDWRRLTIKQRDVLPDDCGITGYSSNAAKLVARNAVIKYIQNVADVDGHPLPILIRRSDKKSINEIDESESLVVLPPQYTKRSLHKDYLNFQIDKSMHLSLTIFMDVLERDLPHIRVSLRAKGLCDLCFVFRETVRTVSDKHLVQRSEEWRSHLNAAENTRDSCRASQAFARTIFSSTV